ncbi:PD40 domain-containing protein [Thermoactinomyces sp. DSM 45892]|uniref:TolB family protein n=1 Tax=Thermoactinomyces sp. DSM 45892 TaxID=1882753 RepID=UPI0008980777|nr:PD40 domain-containing protein [Thermoactinomyces sp. DSM 45892]SDX94714.1 WD40-like Beta Propeller Repeat [Thermoactinomyces sp. DSM 45892]
MKRILTICIINCLLILAPANTFASPPTGDGKVYYSHMIQDGTVNHEPIFRYFLNVANPDGSGGRTLSPKLDRIWDVSPDGKKVLQNQYVSPFENNNIILSNTNGTRPKVLTKGLFAKYSGNGKKIVFIRFCDDTHSDDVFLINTDGTGERRLTHTLDNESDATSNFDGSQVLYATWLGQGETSTRHFNLLKTDGSSEPRDILMGQDDTSPSLSPDGSKIVFARSFSENGDTQSDIYMKSLLDGIEQNLTKDFDEFAYCPLWSNDGSGILFSDMRNSFQSTPFYTMNADGTHIQKIDKPNQKGIEPLRWIK